MEIDPVQLIQVLREIYPRELDHAVSELRARLAEARVRELEGQDEVSSERN